MKHYFLTVLTILAICAVKNIKAQPIACYENGSHTLEFYEDGTFIYKLHPIDILPFSGWQSEDIISFGTFTSTEDKYIISTPKEIKYANLGMNLLQDTLIDSLESITIILNSPFEREKENHKGNSAYSKAYFYMVDAVYRIDNQRKDTVCGPFFSNTITIPCEKTFLESIYVKIYPFKHSNRLTPQFANLETQYRLSNFRSNFFVFEIPKFDTMYLYWLRFENQIINKDNEEVISFEGSNSHLVKDFWKKISPEKNKNE